MSLRSRQQKVGKHIPDLFPCHVRLNSKSQPRAQPVSPGNEALVLLKAADLWSKLSKEIWLASSLGSSKMDLGWIPSQKCQHNWTSWSSKTLLLFSSFGKKRNNINKKTHPNKQNPNLWRTIFWLTVFAFVHGSESASVYVYNFINQGNSPIII